MLGVRSPLARGLRRAAGVPAYTAALSSQARAAPQPEESSLAPAQAGTDNAKADLTAGSCASTSHVWHAPAEHATDACHRPVWDWRHPSQEHTSPEIHYKRACCPERLLGRSHLLSRPGLSATEQQHRLVNKCQRAGTVQQSQSLHCKEGLSCVISAPSCNHEAEGPCSQKVAAEHGLCQVRQQYTTPAAERAWHSEQCRSAPVCGSAAVYRTLRGGIKSGDIKHACCPALRCQWCNRRSLPCLQQNTPARY